MSSLKEIRSVLQEFDQALSDSDAADLARIWQNNLLHADEIRAWLEYGVEDPEVARQRRADQEDMPPYYLEDE